MNRFNRVLGFVAAVMAVPMLFAADPTISLTATPRYPWNGLVDLAFTIEGDDGAKYDTSFSVQDVIGGTNLAMKTVYKSPGVKANAGLEKLVPGTYNWLWDAPADVGNDFVSESVVIDAKVGDAITYSVKFNANGGTGSMANETFESGVAKALTANAFTRMGYTFQGWVTTSTGAVVYSDKQSVSNLSVTPNATVNLYAVWSDAVYMVIDLSGGASAKSYPVSYLSAVPSGGWSSGYKTTKLVLRKCKAGKYSMQKNRSVTLSKDFYIGVFELTQKQYKLITGNTPPENDGDSRPLANVSYDHIHGSSAMSIDSSTVIGKLKSKVGLNVNLPTEAQWEYACRAGTSSDTAINKYGRYSDNTNDGKGGYTGKTTVGSYLPNQWGIYDMRGNVWEWCLDGWVSDLGTKAVTDPVASSDNAYYPVLRGGGYNHGADYCTSYYRMYGIHNNGQYVPHGGNCGHGFRVCITMK